MEKAPGLSSDDVPPYSENLSYTSPTSLPQNLASVRIARIYSLLETHIKPHLLDTTLAGLSCSTLVLIPSNVPSLTSSLVNDSKDGLGQQASFPGEKIAGFTDAGNVTLIRLHGQENSFDFWRQLPVIKDLERALQAQLNRENDNSVVEESVLPAVPELKGWFKKKATSAPQQRTENVKASGSSKVKADVELRDVSLRTENAMGLYETKTGKAIVIKVDFNV
ncbi:hypothetical protein JMJ35_002192 [Cladonia borealis]|uniref:Uncharacterized protein n=1 Tax=Cladonia borealis TaxID=184061 RepID=A0AA39V3M2_9LECA|nr:hypothetical protein JMJ35_002192 [Cladonia borealis]